MLDEQTVGTSETTLEAGSSEPVETTSEVVENPTPQPEERRFSRDEVNSMMRKRVERSHNAFFNRYNVQNLDELDELVSKAMSWDEADAKYNELNQRYGDLENSHKDLTKRYAYKVGNIDEKKISDIETYFKGKGIDIDEKTLMAELKTHPDWVNKVATITQLGAEVSTPSEKDARQEAARIFGVTLR